MVQNIVQLLPCLQPVKSVGPKAPGRVFTLKVQTNTGYDYFQRCVHKTSRCSLLPHTKKNNNCQPKIYLLKSIPATLHVFKVCLLIMKANLSLPVVQILHLGLLVCVFRGFVRSPRRSFSVNRCPWTWSVRWEILGRVEQQISLAMLNLRNILGMNHTA